MASEGTVDMKTLKSWVGTGLALLLIVLSLSLVPKQVIGQGGQGLVIRNYASILPTCDSSLTNQMVLLTGTTQLDVCNNGVWTAVCLPTAFTAQADAATVTWALANTVCNNASLTFTVHSGSRTLNITNPVNGGSYVIWLKQDGTGGEGLTLGTGCTWKVIGGGAGAVALSSGASAIDVLTFTYDGTNCYANVGKNYS
jgi:hypothetical protein